MTTRELCKRLRKDVGLTQKELAEAMGVSVFTINIAENGRLPDRMKNAISKETANKYKEYFGVDIMDQLQNEYIGDLTRATQERFPEKAIEEIRNTYSYTVDGNGCVTTNIKTSEEELMKKREEEDKNYISSLEAENANLKKMLEQTNHDLETTLQDLRECVATNKGLQDQIDSEKACADFYEQRMRELEKENEELVTNLSAREDEYMKLHEDHWGMVSDYESIKSTMFDLLFDFYKNHTDKPE